MSWLDEIDDPPLQLRLKRALDVSAAVAGLLAASPLLVGLTTAELLIHGWPPIYVQPRPGYKGRVFRLYKFRTMTDARDASGRLRPDGERLTRFGTLLRSTSLDELPEFINILRGEMSLVGPRPLMLEYLKYYNCEQRRRHDMPPGLTGWAQVNGRNSSSWERRFEYDLEYIDNWSLWFDAKILLRTVVTVLSRKGISAEGDATMPPFRGSP